MRLDSREKVFKDDMGSVLICPLLLARGSPHVAAAPAPLPRKCVITDLPFGYLLPTAQCGF